MDRASGSGVFARDPDALLDMIELPVSDKLRKQQEDKEVCKICMKWLRNWGKADEISQDDEFSRSKLMDYCRDFLKQNSMDLMQKEIAEAVLNVSRRTAWRIDGTLREFPKFKPVNLWFDYPRHLIDREDVLKDVDPEETWSKNFDKKKSNNDRKKDRSENIEFIFEGQQIDGKASIKDMAEGNGMSEDTVRRHLKEHGGFWIEDGKCGRKA